MRKEIKLNIKGSEMFGIKYMYRTTIISNYAPEERIGIIWEPRFKTIEEALFYAQDCVLNYGYDPNDIHVVKVDV